MTYLYPLHDNGHVRTLRRPLQNGCKVTQKPLRVLFAIVHDDLLDMLDERGDICRNLGLICDGRQQASVEGGPLIVDPIYRLIIITELS